MNQHCTSLPRTKPEMNTDMAFHYFRQLYYEREREDSRTDFVVVIQGRKFPVHKLVLGTFCDFFRDLFSADPDAGVHELKEAKAEDFRLLLEFLYCRAIQLSQLQTSRVIELLALADKILLESFIEYCRKHATTLKDQTDVGEFYSLLRTLAMTKEMKELELLVLKHFDTEASKSKLPPLDKVTPELLAAALKREDLKDGMTQEELGKRHDVLFDWFQVNDHGSVEDLAEDLEDGSPFKAIRRQTLRWLGASKKGPRPPKLGLCKSTGSCSKWSTEVFQCGLGSHVWSRAELKTEVNCELCYVQDRKIFVVENIKCQEYSLKIFEEDNKVVSKSMPLPVGFRPRSVCVIGGIVFVAGRRNEGFWLCRVDSIDGSVKKKDLNCKDGCCRPAMTTSDCDLYVLFGLQLLIVRGGDLERAKVICRFTKEFSDANISVQGHNFTVLSENGHLTLDLTTLHVTITIKNSPCDLQSLPVKGRVFACCRFKDGLSVAIEPEGREKGVRLCWFQPSTNADKAMASFKKLGMLPVNPLATFDSINYYYRSNLTC